MWATNQQQPLVKETEFSSGVPNSRKKWTQTWASQGTGNPGHGDQKWNTRLPLVTLCCDHDPTTQPVLSFQKLFVPRDYIIALLEARKWCWE